MPNATAARPASVTLAVNLLWISLLIGLVGVLIAPDDLPSPPSRHHLDQFGRLVVLAFSAGLFAMIWKGRKWARKALFVILVFGGPATIWYVLKSVPLDPIVAILALVRIGFMITALVLLCQKPSADWFDRHARSAVP